jgi:outer membrane protein assembly factor BamD
MSLTASISAFAAACSARATHTGGRLFGMGMLLLVLASCSGYERLLKSDDFELKYAKARDYYNRGSYNRALPLFKQLLTVEKGTEREEELMYYIAYSHYGQGEYLLAAALFKNYYTFFPRTSRTAECHYMSAYCNYLYSPRVTLDQTATYKAIDAFQTFINAHPQSDSVTAANSMIDVLRNKLERKALNAAELYARTGRPQAASVAYAEILNDFPDIDGPDKIQFQVLTSRMEFADRSVVCKQEERYGEVLQAYAELQERFPESSFVESGARIRERALRERDQARTGCSEQEELRAFLGAEVAQRNKDYARASRRFQAFLREYPESDRHTEAQVQLIRCQMGWAEDASEACLQRERFEEALSSYYAFAEGDAAKAEDNRKWLEQAEKLYGRIIEAQDAAKADCATQPNTIDSLP